MNSSDYPLFLAAKRGNIDAVKFLLQHGSNADSPLRPLVAAARSGCDLCVELLLDNGADANATLDGVTALRAACDDKLFSIAELLLERGADPHTEDDFYPFNTSLRCGEYLLYTVFKHVLIHASEQCVDPITRTGVRVLCKFINLGISVEEGIRDKVSLVKLLLRCECLEEAKAIIFNLPASAFKDFSFVLYHAAKYNWLDCVTLLLDNGICVDSCHMLGYRRDHSSVREGDSSDDDSDDVSDEIVFAGTLSAQSNKLSERIEMDVCVTALVGACEMGQSAMVEYLLSRGANPNSSCTNHRSRVPLVYAASRGDLNILRILIGAGALLSAIDCIGNSEREGSDQDMHQRITALHVACEKGDVESVTMLLKSNIDVNITDERGFTGLHVAACGGNFEIAKILIDYGADVNHRSLNDETPLTAMCSSLNTDSSLSSTSHRLGEHWSELYQKNGLQFSLKTRRNDVCTTSAQANNCFSTETGRLRNSQDYAGVLRLLLDNGADVNTVINTTGETALYRASATSRSDLVRMLLTSGAQLHNKTLKSPLCIACSQSQSSNVRLLLDHGSNPNSCSMSESFPLCIAAEANDIVITVMLLQAGASVNLARDRVERTALHRAVGAIRKVYPLEIERLECRTAVVQKLLDHGANVNVTDRLEETPLRCTVRSLKPANLRVYCNKLEEDLHMRSKMRIDIATLCRIILPTIQKFVRTQLEVLSSLLGPTGNALLDDSTFVLTAPTARDDEEVDLGLVLDANPIGQFLIEMFLKNGATSRWLCWLAKETYTAGFQPSTTTLNLCKAIQLAGHRTHFSLSSRNHPRELELSVWLKSFGEEIPRLMRLTRVSIRSQLFDVCQNQNIATSVTDVPLPDELTSYLLFEGPLSEVTLQPSLITDAALLNMLKLRCSTV